MSPPSSILVPSVGAGVSLVASIGGPGAEISQSPTTGDYSINIQAGLQPFQLDASSPPLAPGDCFCLLPGQLSGTVVTKALPLPMASSGAIAGVAVAPVAAGASFQGATGLVPASLSGVPPGDVPSLITVNPSAELAKIVQPSGSGTHFRPGYRYGDEVIVGMADTQGNVTLLPTASVISSPHHVVSIRAFGIVGDGVTRNTKAQWDAMMQAIGDELGSATVPQGFNGRLAIYVPPGSYVWDLPPGGRLSIPRSLHIYGDHMGYLDNAIAGVPATSFIFPNRGSGGVQVESQTSVPGQLSFGVYSLIENLTLAGPGYEGTTARCTRWSPGATVTTGTVIKPNVYQLDPVPGDAPDGGAISYVWVAQNSGTTGASEPSWPTTYPWAAGITVHDNGITWEAFEANGFAFRETAYARNVRISGFDGNGFDLIASSALGTQSSLSMTENCTAIDNSGNGMAVARSDANQSIHINFSGITNLGFGVRDYANLGNTYLGGHMRSNTAGSWYSDSSQFFHPYAEAGQGPPVFLSSAMVYGPNFGDNLTGEYKQLDTVVQTRDNLTGYSFDDIMVTVSSGTAFYWICTQGGTSDASEPDFDHVDGSPTRVGPNNDESPRFVVDGSVHWMAYGYVFPIPENVFRSGGFTPFHVRNLGSAENAGLDMGEQNDPLCAFALTNSLDAQLVKMKLDPAATPTGSRWFLQGGAGGATRFYELTRAGATEGDGQVNFPSGFWIGSASHYAIAETLWSGGVDVGDDPLPAVDTKKSGLRTADATVTTVEVFPLPTATTSCLTEISCRVIAKALTTGDGGATFLLRGSWLNKAGTVIDVGAPEVVYGEPTDATHATNGTGGTVDYRPARAFLTRTGANVLVQVQGLVGVPITWSVVREAVENMAP